MFRPISALPDDAPRLSRWRPYVFALLAACFTLGLRLAFDSWCEGRPILILLVVPVVFSAYAGGFGPGLLCTLVVALGANYFLFKPYHSFLFEQSVEFAQWLILILVGVIVSITCGDLRWKETQAAEKHQKLKPTGTERKIQAGFGLALACLAVIGIFSYLAVVQLREDAAWVEHTRDVISRTVGIQATMTDAENGYRGFAISGDEGFLVPFDDANRRLPAEFVALSDLLRDNPAQHARLGTLKGQIAEQFAFGLRVIEARRNSGLNAAKDLVTTRRGMQLHNETKNTVDALRDTEEAFLKFREANAAASATNTQLIIVTGSLFAFGFVGLSLVAIRRDLVGRRLAEEALQRSENSLAVTLDSIGEAVLATNNDGTIVRLNHVAETLTGWSNDHAQGKPVEAIFAPFDEETRERIKHPAREVLTSGKPYTAPGEILLADKNGRELLISLRAAPILDQAEQMLGSVIVFRDVSLERAAELRLATAQKELADERARLKFIFESVPIGISLETQSSHGDHRLYCNAAYLSISGLTKERFESLRTLEKITHPDDLDIVRRHARELNQEKVGRVSFDKRLIRPDGSVIWIQHSLQQRQLEHGVEKLSLIADITERKRAVAELERFFTLSLDFLCIASADGYFKRVSPAVTDILGWEVEEFLTIPFMDLVHPEDQEATQLEVERQTVLGESVLQFENRYRHKDGSWRTLSWRSVPQPNGLMYATARDVTQRKRIDDQIRNLNAQLQDRALQLESANKELESFSYSVSHDLRAPLRHVQGFVGMLLADTQEQLSAQSRRYLNVISESSKAMGRLIDDLLSFSKMGRAELQERRVQTQALVESVIRDLDSATQGRHVSWEVRSLPDVSGDPALLKQVFVNLLDNAIKYTRTAAAAEISVVCQGLEGGRLVFYVKDNGAGFDMKYAEKLFGVFQRLHRADEFEGTGIGLANVQRILARHGGRIWAEAAPQKGATFFFTLKPASETEASSPLSS